MGRRAADVAERPVVEEAVIAAATPVVDATPTVNPVKLTPGQYRRTRNDAIARGYETRSKRLTQQLNALTAAAQIVDPMDKDSSLTAPNSVSRTWQHAAWGFVNTVPELKAAKMFVGNCMSRIPLVVGKRDASGQVEQGFDGDEPVDGMDAALADEAAEIISELRAPRGGQSELGRAFGEKMFIAGEGWLLPLDTPNGKTFEFLSTNELVRDGDGWARYEGPGGKKEQLTDLHGEPIRFWRGDSQFSMMADSSVRSCLEILEELTVLTRLVKASAISRMALAGLLLIPDELDTVDEEGNADGDLSEAQNPLGTDLINTASKAIDDPASSAAYVPFIIQGPADLLEKVRHIAFQTDDHENTIKRTEALERLGQGLDIPKEVVLGHMETTFANAAQISQDTFQLHLQPMAQMWCDGLTETVLWPSMAGARSIDAEALKTAPYPEGIQGVAVTYDARKLVSKPDRAKEIIDLFVHDTTQSSIAVSEVREAVGLDPDGGPDDEEIAKRVDAIRLTKIREIIQADPGDAAVPVADASAGKAVVPGQSGGDAAIKRGENRPEPGDAGSGPGIAGNAGGGQTETQQLEEESGVAASGWTPTDDSRPIRQPAIVYATKISGAADLAIERALEKVGAKLRNKARSNPEFAPAIDGVQNSRVAAALGRPTVEILLGNDEIKKALASELGTFSRCCSTYAEQAGSASPGLTASFLSRAVQRLAEDALYSDTRGQLSVQATALAIDRGLM